MNIGCCLSVLAFSSQARQQGGAFKPCTCIRISEQLNAFEQMNRQYKTRNGLVSFRKSKTDFWESLTTYSSFPRVPASLGKSHHDFFLHFSENLHGRQSVVEMHAHNRKYLFRSISRCVHCEYQEI